MHALFYAKFDDEKGPSLVYQVPDGPDEVFSAASFDCVSGYVVALDSAVCGSLVTVSTARRQTVASFPICLEDARYARHRLAFSVGIVVASVDDVATYEPLLRNAAQLLERLEVEREFLSRDGDSESAAEHQQLRAFLREVWRSVRECGRCAVSVTPDDREVSAANTLRFELRRPPASAAASPAAPHEWEVPVLTRSLGAEASAGWDLALRRVLPFIDGTSCIRRIAFAADVDVALVRQVVQQLIYFGAAAVVDIFQYSNLYIVTADIARLVASRTLRHACQAYVCGIGRERGGSGGGSFGGGADSASSPPLPSTSSGFGSSLLQLAPSASSGTSFSGALSGALSGAQSGSQSGSLACSSSAKDIELADSTHSIGSVSSAASSAPRQREATVLPLLLQLFAALDGTTTVAQLCARFGAAMQATRVDARRLVVWGQIHGLLKRVHAFALPSAPGAGGYGRGTLAELIQKAAKMGGGDAEGGGGSGPLHMDALCVRALRSFQEIDMEARANTHLVVVQSAI